MHEEMIQRLGIERADCSTCFYLGSDGDGPEYNGSWPVCDKIERMGYLKSFPFKKQMPCWEPEFWHSKFAGSIKTGEHEEILYLIGCFVAARDALPAKYRHMWE